MNLISRSFLASIVLLLLVTVAPAQLSLSSAAAGRLVDFDSGLDGVSSGPFSGVGFSPMPLDGQLDSDAWSVTGFSDGDLAFGGTVVGGDLARGSISGGGTSTGGLYALADFPGTDGRSIAFQPGGTDFTPGSLTLRIVNSDPEELLIAFAVSYDIYERNDAGRSSSLAFSYSEDGSIFVPLPSMDHATLEAADPSPSFVKIGGKGPSRSAVVSGISIAPGEFLYLRWESDDLSGTGSRDEIALDNISVAGTFLGTTNVSGFIQGEVKRTDGPGVPFVRITVTDGSGVDVGTALTNQFGSFSISGLPVGASYIVRAVSGKLSIAEPVVAVVLDGAFATVTFEATEKTGAGNR